MCRCREHSGGLQLTVVLFWYLSGGVTSSQLPPLSRVISVRLVSASWLGSALTYWLAIRVPFTPWICKCYKHDYKSVLVLCGTKLQIQHIIMTPRSYHFQIWENQVRYRQRKVHAFFAREVQVVLSPLVFYNHQCLELVNMSHIVRLKVQQEYITNVIVLTCTFLPVR